MTSNNTKQEAIIITSSTQSSPLPNPFPTVHCPLPILQETTFFIIIACVTLQNSNPQTMLRNYMHNLLTNKKWGWCGWEGEERRGKKNDNLF